ncbi:MAG: alkyl sulfatase dimerization domain-containing protein [Pseudomonadota bacterium]
MNVWEKLSIVLLVLALAACAPEQSAQPEPIAPAPTPMEDIVGQLPPPGTATAATKAMNMALTERLPLHETSDYDDASRGFLAAIKTDAIRNEDGEIVWSIPQFDFLSGDAPDTVNPSLWRQSQLAAKHGLFEVMDGVYQVRGYDLAVMSIIAGETGWIIIDPLTAVETAAAALSLVNETLGERPVSAMIYTHSHVDHFGGARGIIDDDELAVRPIPILAPVGFSESAVAENLLAGTHMARRASLMFGSTIERSAHAHVGSGLGPGLPNGVISLLLPTEEIDSDGTPRTIDGVVFEFIDAAGTEAPAEFMFYLPEKRALCTAEVVSATLHNILTPRGAKVRDARAWSRSIDDLLDRYGDKSDVVFASHHWPTWGADNINSLLSRQRDVYRYIHDQTLRYANSGASQAEAAEAITEPLFQSEWFDTRGYYGTLNHNSKAVYQHYFGWWGGVPADYYALPRIQTAGRYVRAMGGADHVLELAQTSFAKGDYRWVAELLNHLVFAEPENTEARQWLAAAYEQLGFQAESGAWRSYFLTAAQELRQGAPDLEPLDSASSDFLSAVPSLELFDALAARYDTAKLNRDPFALQFDFTDTEETITLLVTKAVIVPRAGPADEPLTSVSMTRQDFDRLITRDVGPLQLVVTGRMKLEGDRGALSDMFDSLETPDFWFNIVEP